MTQYRVMKKLGAANVTEPSKVAWEYVGSHEAGNATAAIRAYMKNAQGATPGEYVAVPDRSWKPLTVKVETQTKLSLS